MTPTLKLRGFIQNSKLFIKRYWRIYRYIVEISRFVWTLLLIGLSLLVFAGVMGSLFAMNYSLTLIYVVIFAILATLMIRMVDYYGT
jgi:uncharacterized membrane protein